MNEPLIWTTKGNLPVASLHYEVSWNILKDQVQFHERYFQGDELVRENSHIKLLEGVAISGEASI
jgi:hypothetical protein